MADTGKPMGAALPDYERAGELLNGRYELCEALAQSETDETYVARDQKHNRKVQIKLLRAQFALQGKVVQRFLNQSQASTGFVQACVESDQTGIPFIVYEQAVAPKPDIATAATLLAEPIAPPAQASFDELDLTEETPAPAPSKAPSHRRDQGETKGSPKAKARQKARPPEVKVEASAVKAKAPEVKVQARALPERPKVKPALDKGTAPIGSPKQLRQANTPKGTALTEEQMRVIRERLQKSEQRSTRMLGALLVLVFAFALLFALPLLYDPTRTQAQALLGTRTKLASGGLAILAVIALVRTWTLQIQQKPMLLRPVTITLKVVTATICVLSASFFLPDGALGPVERAARGTLPWAAGAFYLCLGCYGLLHGLRKLGSNPLAGIAMALLYGSGFFGSYRAIDSTVLQAKRNGGAAAQASGQIAPASLGQLRDLAQGKLPQGTLSVPQAAPAPKERARAELGNSEADDMAAIEHLRESRKHSAAEAKAIEEAARKALK